jgi:hypothetical protein
MVAEGYNTIATSEGVQFGGNKAVVLKSSTQDWFDLELNGTIHGSFTRAELEIIVHVFKDVLELTRNV